MIKPKKGRQRIEDRLAEIEKSLADLLPRVKADITTKYVRKRGRPFIEDRLNTFAATKPWLKIVDPISGKPMSRTTWYRRRKEKEQGK
jgi:hypothetical protein